MYSTLYFKQFLNFCRLCLLFVYMPILQRELEEIKEDWNQHKIRLQKKTDRPNGVPNDLYDFPEEKGLKVLWNNYLHVALALPVNIQQPAFYCEGWDKVYNAHHTAKHAWLFTHLHCLIHVQYSGTSTNGHLSTTSRIFRPNVHR